MENIILSTLLAGMGEVSEVVASKYATAVTVDSRNIQEGNVFVAIKGERVDGHDYVADAIEKGAVIAIVEHPVNDVMPENQFVVNNSLDAMIAMGKNYRLEYTTKLIAVTGSVGKTTTKEFLHCVFSAFGKTLKNEGNKNNEIGLPETLFNLNETYDYGVLEMGMTASGDIDKLTDAVKPIAAIITNIGVAHIEQLKSRENILNAKLEIVNGIAEGGLLVINKDNDMLCNIKVRDDIKLLSFGIDSNDADIVATELFTDDYDTNFKVENKLSKETFNAKIPALGKHNVYNALSAYSVAYGIGLDGKVAIDALKNYQSCGMRQRIVPQSEFVVIEDCYNANPDSMRAAIDTLSNMPDVTCKIAVLGDMLELGDLSENAHREIGKILAEKGVDSLVAYGDMAKYIAQEAEGAVENVGYSDDRLIAMDYLNEFYKDNCAILFKASRGMMLEELMELFYIQRGY